ncbi:MAG: metalloenzyme, partial [Acidobacteria bacterium]|nr:metalloenzyme [Acidobacteriota bacterium]
MKSKEQTAVLLFFIDGLGIGIGGEHNPLARIENIEPLAHFKYERSKIIFDGVLIPTDARLGIEGRPQSASGQTTILTGVNAPQHLGVHKQGFPNQALRDLIADYSI